MSKKQHSRESVERKIDLRNVMIDENMDTRIDEYILLQKKRKKILKRGEAAVELIGDGLKANGI